MVRRSTIEDAQHPAYEWSLGIAMVWRLRRAERYVGGLHTQGIVKLFVRHFSRVRSSMVIDP